MTQLPLFGSDEPTGEAEPSPADASTPPLLARTQALADALPHLVHFGTMSWAFPGWAGLVYPHDRAKTRLAHLGLGDYVRCPVLRTVEIDRSFYAPIPDADLERYAAQLPRGYRCVIKAPQSVTGAAVFDPGMGSWRVNPDYLSIERLELDLLDGLAARFAGHCGPIVLEFPRMPRELRVEPTAFFGALETFAARLPRGFEYAVEIRDRRFLQPAYAALLERHQLAHAFTYWGDMPSIADQADVVSPARVPFVLCRLLLRPGTRYGERRDEFAPFDRIVAPDERMRAEVTDLVAEAMTRGRRVWVLANNKAEGSAPLTLLEIAKRVVRALANPQAPR